MFREAAQLLKQFIMFLTHVSTFPPLIVPCGAFYFQGEAVGVYSLKKVRPVGSTGRRNLDYKRGIRGVIRPGWQLVALWRYLLLVPSQSSSVLLHIITAVNLLVPPLSCPILSFLIILPLPTWDFCLFPLQFFLWWSAQQSSRSCHCLLWYVGIMNKWPATWST